MKFVWSFVNPFFFFEDIYSADEKLELNDFGTKILEYIVAKRFLKLPITTKTLFLYLRVCKI